MRKMNYLLVAGCFVLLGATAKKIDDKPKGKIVVRVERTVTLDVKDAEVKDIFKSMQKQCAIKNVILDPNVKGKGTFYLHKVPCSTAFSIVMRTLGLQSSNSTEAMLSVGNRQR